MQCTERCFECYLCQQRPISMKELKSHMIVNHCGWKRFQCQICSRSFFYENSLKYHLKSHSRAITIKCNYCSKFIDNRMIRNHETFCKRKYECFLCKKQCTSYKMLKFDHMKIHMGKKPYKCKHCTKSFEKKDILNNHSLDRHMHMYGIQCNICNETIEKNRQISTHRASCMGKLKFPCVNLFTESILISYPIIFFWHNVQNIVKN